MNRRLVAAATAMFFSVFVAQPVAAVASPFSKHTDTTRTAKVKTVSFHLRNDSSSPLMIQAGDQQMTIAPGQSAALKLAEGTQVTTTNGTSHIAAGGVVTTVTSVLQGSTLAVS